MNPDLADTLEGAGREAQRLVAPQVQPPSEHDPKWLEHQRKLVASVRGYIIREVRKIAPGASPKQRAELAEWGEDGARKATRNHDPAKGKFITYAAPFIRGAMQDGLSRKYRDVNMTRAVRLLASELLGEPQEMEACWDTDEVGRERLHRVTARCIVAVLACIAAAPPDPEQALINEQLSQIVEEVFAKVIPTRPRREQQIWALRFQQGWKLEPIAEALGVSVSQVGRYQEDLLDAVYAVLHERGVLEAPRRRP